mgnify:CR=1 FL=1
MLCPSQHINSISEKLEGLTSSNGRLARDTVRGACEHLGHADRHERINKKGSGWVLAAQLDKVGSLSAATFAEWWVLETFVDGVQECVVGWWLLCAVANSLTVVGRFACPVKVHDDHLSLL